jgi:hypothetical protein
MGSTSRHGRAVINPNAPEALGICDGCGFLFNLRELRWQMYWCGTTLKNKHLRKCSQCLDIPNEQFRTIILPPDPPPVFDTRTEPYSVDERNEYTLSKLIGLPYMFPVVSNVTVLLSISSTLVAQFLNVSSITAALRMGVDISPNFEAVSSIAAELFVPPNYRITEDSDFRITEDGDRRITE